MAMRPQKLHTCTRYGSLTSNSLSLSMVDRLILCCGGGEGARQTKGKYGRKNEREKKKSERERKEGGKEEECKRKKRK